MGDFNGDGKADFAYAVSETYAVTPPANIVGGDWNSSGQLVVRLGSGGGVFGNPILVGDAKDSISYIGSGDFNGDGKLDLVTVGAGLPEVTYGPYIYEISVYLGNGDGTFQPAIKTFGITQPAAAPVVADFTSHGHDDIVLSEYVSSADGLAESIYLLSGNGDGTFQPQELIRTVPVFAFGYQVQSADFNNDGVPDLVLGVVDQVTPSRFEVDVLLNHGDGTFELADSLSTMSDGFVIGDFDDDGMTDLAVGYDSGDEQGLEFFRGRGNGRFDAGVVSYDVGPDPVVAADMNGDGRLDIVSGDSDGDLQVTLGDGDGHFAAIATYSPGRAISGIGIGDLNGDGVPDIIETESDETQGFRVLLANPGGTFNLPLPNVGSPFFGQVAFADLKGDGSIEFIGCDPSNQSILVAPYLQSGLLGPGVAYSLPTDNGDDAFNSFVVGDFNGDGKPDLAVLLSDELVILLNRGDGTFQSPEIYHFAGPAVSFAMGDLNRDGVEDLVVSSGGDAENGLVSVYIGRGDGTFLPPLATSIHAHSVAVADMNSDGIPDLVSVQDPNGIDTYGASVSVSLGNGDGTFRPAVVRSMTDVAYAWSAQFVIGDFTGDHKLDFATIVSSESDPDTHEYEDGSIAVFPGNGDGSFGAPILTAEPGSFLGELSAVDFNQDGKLDLLENLFNTGWGILFGNGDGTFADAVNLGLSGESLAAASLAPDQGPALVAFGPSLIIEPNSPINMLTPVDLDVSVAGLTDVHPVVARFEEQPQVAPAGVTNAMISWGDHTTNVGTIVADGVDPATGWDVFDIIGEHQYLQNGTYISDVTVGEADGLAQTWYTDINVETGQQQLAASPLALDVGVANVSSAVATLFDYGSGDLSSYSAVIDWGDGSATSTGTISTSGTPDANGRYQFVITGQHAYAVSGQYATTISMIDQYGATTSVAHGTVTVSNPALSSIAGEAVSALEDDAGDWSIATFTPADPAAVAADFSARVIWGDEPNAVGPDGRLGLPAEIQALGNGQFVVTANRSLNTSGTFARK